jgi:hypothetical protein
MLSGVSENTIKAGEELEVIGAVREGGRAGWIGTQASRHRLYLASLSFNSFVRTAICLAVAGNGDTTTCLLRRASPEARRGAIVTRLHFFPTNLA